MKRLTDRLLRKAWLAGTEAIRAHAQKGGHPDFRLSLADPEILWKQNQERNLAGMRATAKILRGR